MSTRDKTDQASQLIGTALRAAIRAATILRQDGQVAAADRIWRACVEMMDVSGQLLDLAP